MAASSAGRVDCWAGRSAAQRLVHPADGLLDGADHLRMAGVADQQDVAAGGVVTLGLDMDLGHQGAGGVQEQQFAGAGAGGHRLGHAVRREHHRAVVRAFVQFLDEDRAHGLQPLDHVAVVHDLVAHVDRPSARALRLGERLLQVARIALGMDALRTGAYDAALQNLDLPDSSELDTLLLGQLSAWADAGKGDAGAAIRRLDEISGPPWFAIFNLYQKGLIFMQAGQPDEARRVLKVLLDDRASVQTSPDAYLAAVEALARLEMQAGNKDAAEEALAYGLQVAPTYDPILFLERQLDAGEAVTPTVQTPQQGASEVLYTLGQAINRGDGRDVALLYFQLADAVSETTSDKLVTALAGVVADVRSSQATLSTAEADHEPH